ncbi:ankyrin repeat and kh domain-containing protein 1 [Plakobranchus ocellatus]|uniref:Ankyrin repeat and kh domain-containing protein 1 n=1 Tax=Plakobranchus ocellatus TaxID=259542 RepID=A0AAV4C8H3_9GAST|nr:ankyrin repeat and kh domain-containing protein 1 [Plakobranchus ocellatus]
MAACSKGYDIIVDDLLKHHAQIDMENADELTPLMIACVANHRNVVKVLLEHKTDTKKITSQTSVTALMLAQAQGHDDIVNDLMQHNVQINIQDKDKGKAVMPTCSGRDDNAAKVLLAHKEGHGGEEGSYGCSRNGSSSSNTDDFSTIKCRDTKNAQRDTTASIDEIKPRDLKTSEERNKTASFEKIRSSIMYRRFQDPGRDISLKQVTLPNTLRGYVMSMAHDSITGAHLEIRETKDKVLSNFDWPGVDGDLTRYCRS